MDELPSFGMDTNRFFSERQPERISFCGLKTPPARLPVATHRNGQDSMSNATPAKAEKLILVHGTFANRHSDEGNSWWQLGSSTTNGLLDRLPADVELPKQGEVFHWSGENSERERIKAADDLLQHLRNLEAEGTHYHLIGHSHGGSVIWHALRQSILERRPLSTLRSWATVGTPFLHLKSKGGNSVMLWLNIALALILVKPALITLAKILQLFFPYDTPDWLRAQLNPQIDQITFWNTPVLWIMERLGEPIERTSNGIRVGSLQADKDLTLTTFFSHYEGWLLFGTALLVLYVIINIIIFLVSPVLEALRIKAEHRLEDDTFHVYGKRWIGLWSPDDEAINGLRATLNLSVSFVSKLMIREPVLLSDYLMLVSRPYYWLLNPLFNFGLRPLLDKTVRSIVIKKAQGNNRPAAEVIRVGSSPLHCESNDPFPPIPPILNKQIVDKANQSAGGAASTFRKLLAAPSFAAGLEHLGSQISGTELVHTSYFDHGPILDILSMHIVWSQNNPFWFQYNEQYDPEIANWFVQFKKEVGADEHLLQLPTPAVGPNLLLFAPEEPPSNSAPAKQKPRRRAAA